MTVEPRRVIDVELVGLVGVELVGVEPVEIILARIADDMDDAPPSTEGSPMSEAERKSTGFGAW